MKNSPIRIEAPVLPPAEWSPNAQRGIHWSIKKKVGDEFGNVVYLAALQSMTKYKGKLPFEKAKIDVKIIVKQHRRRDLDNWWARMKMGVDALVKAGILVDDDVDHLQHGEMVFEVNHKYAPVLIIEVWGEG